MEERAELKELFLRRAWTFVSYVHVESVVRGLPAGSRVMSIGGGDRLISDRLLARRFPKVEFVGTDMQYEALPAEELPNNFYGHKLDICESAGKEEFDLVYSIECLEHIEDDTRALGNAISNVRAGGELLLILPFATRRDQADKKQIERQWEKFEHVRVGYDKTSLERLMRPYRFEEVVVENCYWLYSNALRAYKDSVYEVLGEAICGAVEELARCDIRPGCLAKTREEAVGIKLLATGKQAG